MCAVDDCEIRERAEVGHVQTLRKQIFHELLDLSVILALYDDEVVVANNVHISEFSQDCCE